MYFHLVANGRYVYASSINAITAHFNDKSVECLCVCIFLKSKSHLPISQHKSSTSPLLIVKIYFDELIQFVTNIFIINNIFCFSEDYEQRQTYDITMMFVVDHYLIKFILCLTYKFQSNFAQNLTQLFTMFH